MKPSFTLPRDGKVHIYCVRCYRENPHQLRVAGSGWYYCQCNTASTRALIVDPQVVWWVDGQGEYWHEAAGVFISNPRGEFLFFDRARYPFGLAVPAGHVDSGEKPKVAAVREVAEETGIRLKRLAHIASDDVQGDECRRGADAHRWHCFVSKVPADTPVNVQQQEGSRPVWLTLEAALGRNLTFVTRYMITHYGHTMLRVLR